MSTRELAMQWWNSLGSASKTQICDTNTELVGSVRRWETLTGREIELIWLTYQKPDAFDIEKYLDSIGEKGSLVRLNAIAFMDLGARSEAAKRAIENRYMRKEIMDKGLSFEDAVLLVNRQNFEFKKTNNQ